MATTTIPTAARCPLPIAHRHRHRPYSNRTCSGSSSSSSSRNNDDNDGLGSITTPTTRRPPPITHSPSLSPVTATEPVAAALQVPVRIRSEYWIPPRLPRIWEKLFLLCILHCSRELMTNKFCIQIV